jgi:serine/threonine-protein kinase HipA
VATTLALWLYGTKVARVVAPNGRIRLQYSDEALAKYRIGTPVLSIGLPLRPDLYTANPTRAFLDGLLPEGSARLVIAQQLGIDSPSTFDLLEALGRDCAGAIVVQQDEELAPPEATTLTARPLTADEVAQKLTNLPQAPLGVGGATRLSLAGVQDKLVLTRLASGQWGEPVNGTPSTHILKPAGERFANLVENEAFCMNLASHLGLEAAKVEVETIGGRKVLVVERFDRVVSPEARVERVHQEDFCQALLRPTEHKYEDHGGPKLREIAAVLLGTTSPASLETLLQAVTLNLLIGNCDAHGKNFSLIHLESGQFRLAPLYDLVSTLFYSELEQHLAMKVDGLQRIERVTLSRLIKEATSWGLAPNRARQIIRDVFERLPAAIEAAEADTPGVPAGIPELVRGQLQQLSSEDAA